VDDALVAIRRRWLAIALAIALGALAGGLLRSGAEPSYEATAKVLLEQQRPVDVLLGVDQPPTDPTRDLSTGVRLIVLEPVVDRVRRRLGVPGSTQALLARVSAKLDGNTNIVDITARDEDPRQAARIADAFANEFRQLRAESAGVNVTEAVEAGRRQLRRLGPGADQTPVGRELVRDIRRLEILAAFQTGGVQIVRRATVPAAPSGMSVTEAEVLGGLLGALLAMGLAVVLARADRRLHAEEDVERGLGVEVLAVIPRAALFRRAGRRRAGRRRAGAVHEAGREDAFATLAARVAFGKLEARPQVVLVSSVGEGEGTTEVVLGLVSALGGLGRCALAIDADLRAAALTEAAGAEPRAGLGALLTGERRPEALEDEVVELPVLGSPASRQDGSAWLLPAGRAAVASQALLAGPQMAAVIEEARLRADIVVIAGGPLAERGHAMSLAHAVDSVLLVVRRGRTRQAAARRALHSLQAIEARVLGAALTGAPRSRGDRRAARRRREPAAAAAAAADAESPADTGRDAAAPPHEAVSP
jgi:capsular polysaccharide biosynthesis protein/Mrp family chromosome partitioning ATPase